MFFVTPTRGVRADVLFDATGSFQGGQALGGSIDIDTTNGTIISAALTVTGQPVFDYVSSSYPISPTLQIVRLTSPASESVPGISFPALTLVLPSSLVDYSGGAITPLATGTTPGLNIPIEYGSGVAVLTGSQPGNLISGSLSMAGGCSGVLTGAVHASPGSLLSTSNQFSFMTATFMPANGMTLSQAASACGFSAFDFQQFITGIGPEEDIEGTKAKFLTLPRDDPPSSDSCPGYPYYYDAKNSGIDHLFGILGPNCSGVNLNRSEYSAMQLSSITSNNLCVPGSSLHTGTGDPAATILEFCDAPSNEIMGDIKTFSTNLIGISDGSNGYIVGATVPLYNFTWQSNLIYGHGMAPTTGTGGVSTSRELELGDLSAATGGVELLTLNGVPVIQAPKSVPEPATFLLVTVGLLGMGLKRATGFCARTKTR